LRSCNKNNLEELRQAYRESPLTLLHKIRQFMIMNNEPPMDDLPDEFTLPLNNIPSLYLKIWELEILLRIQKKHIPIMDKFFELFAEMPSFASYADWSSFIIMTPGPPGRLDLDEKNMSEYILGLLKELQSSRNRTGSS
jgi:hypothetical protein